jgi:hypothetical protein
MLKSPEEFIRGLQGGKFQPSDRLLVRDGTAVEWIPIEEIHQFKLDSESFETLIDNGSSQSSQDIFDHIRQPRFNFSALALGGFWYFLHGMPRRGGGRLLLTAAVLVGMLFTGLLLDLTATYLLPLIFAGWMAMGIYSAMRADHDLNLQQLMKFHRIQPRSVGDVIEPDMIRLLNEESTDPYIPTLREKILN